jgi:hypothetical protein
MAEIQAAHIHAAEHHFAQHFTRADAGPMVATILVFGSFMFGSP